MKKSKVLFILCCLLIVSIFLIVAFTGDYSKTNEFIKLQDYLDKPINSVQHFVDEDITLSFFDCDGKLAFFDESGTVTMIAFNPIDSKTIERTAVESKLKKLYGESCYTDNQINENNNQIFNYYKLNYNEETDKFTYFVAMYENEVLVRFALTRLTEDIELLTTTQETTTQLIYQVPSETSAIRKAENYVLSNPRRVIQKSIIGQGITDYKLFEIGSTVVERSPAYFDESASYTIIVKGNFYAYDEYGNWSAKYNFEARVIVYALDGDKSLNSVNLITTY